MNMVSFSESSFPTFLLFIIISIIYFLALNVLFQSTSKDVATVSYAEFAEMQDSLKKFSQKFEEMNKTIAIMQENEVPIIIIACESMIDNAVLSAGHSTNHCY